MEYSKTFIRKLERILIKLYRQNVSLSFNRTCLNESDCCPTTHTHTHTLTHIYIEREWVSGVFRSVHKISFKSLRKTKILLIHFIYNNDDYKVES